MNFRKLILISLLVVLALSLPLGAASAQEAPTNTITVVGAGTAYSAPTVAYLSLGVDVANEDITTAVNDTNARIEAIKGALGSLGVDAADVRTENFFIYRETIYDNGMPTDRALFRVNNTLRITVRDIVNVPNILAAAIDAGANAVNNVTYGIDDSSAVESQARAAAFANAQAKAQELAALMGVQLGEVVAVSEFSATNDPFYANYGMGGGGGGMGGVTPPPVEGGALAINVSIQVTFAVVR